MSYLGSAGVQQFSITIASGSTTGTATISAVGSGAFIIYGGVNPSVGNNVSEELAYLTLTNSTTITAKRNTGTTGTVVVTGCIIDGDTTNLIKSVQFGTVAIAAFGGSGTATISTVTNANTAIGHLGNNTSHPSTFDGLQDIARLSLSGTTVTATRGTASSPAALTIGFVIVEFQGSALNQSVQNVSASSSGTVSSWTASITTVNTSNPISFFGGFTYPSSNNFLSSCWQNGVLTNGTTFTAASNNSISNVRVYNASVVEFVSGVLNSAVQRSTTTLTGVASGTASITGVTLANSGISFLGNTTSVSSNVDNEGMGECVLTNGTTVTTQKNNATGNITSSWEVFEFTTGGGVTVLPINNLGGWFGI